MIKLSTYITNMPRELKLFVAASLAMGMAYSVVDATFNNYLNQRFALSGFQRSFLEFPREMPGFLVLFVSALLWFLCSRRLGVVSMLLGAAGALLIGFASPTYMFMVAWLFIYSLGQHVSMPLSSTIGMELASEGKTGQRLGQLHAIRNLSAILGSCLVFIGFKFLGLTFHHTFAFSALAFGVAALLMFTMKPDKTQKPSVYLKLHKEYRLYYLFSVLHGSRKQIFLTFGPWVLVSVFRQPTQTIAFLLTIGGLIGIVFQPFLGWSIDHFGERRIFLMESILLVLVCCGYGLAGSFFSKSIAFLVTCVCFLLDQMLMSVNMARSTYIKKIAIHPSHVQPALTASVSIDHIFSITVALLGGLIWNTFGYEYVFLLGAVIAVGIFMASRRIHIPAE